MHSYAQDPLPSAGSRAELDPPFPGTVYPRYGTVTTNKKVGSQSSVCALWVGASGETSASNTTAIRLNTGTSFFFHFFFASLKNYF